MIRVLQITGGLNTGGLETVAMNIVRYADPGEAVFDFLVYGEQIGAYEEEAEQLGCRVIHAGHEKNPARQYRQVKKIIRENGPYDVVYSHTFLNSGIVMRAAKKAGVRKCIAHAHQSERPGDKRIDRRLFYAVMRRWLNRYSDSRLACSSDAGRFVFGNNSFTVVRNGIDIEKFSFDPSARERIRTELGIEENTFVIGSIGRISVAKNHAFMVEMFGELQKNNKGARMLLVGDGNLRRKTEALIREKGLEQKVIMTGTRKDVPELLSAMDVFLLPSIHEGVGISAIEAQASGLITFCSDTVPKEVQASHLLKFLSLKEGPAAWAEAADCYSEGYQREDARKEIRDAGYDIRLCMKTIEDLILN